MADYLSMLLSGLGGGQQAAPPTPPQPPTVDVSGKPIDPNATTEVAPIEVTAPAKPPPAAPPIQYDNSKDAAAVQQSLANAPPLQGGSANPGLWGLLPQNVQHGTLRNVLGALGDGFLMHEGQRPAYSDRMNNQEIGRAMAGYANNPQAAIERVATTGANGSVEMADKMENNLQNLQIRQQVAQQNNSYRQAMMASRNDSIIQRMAPMVAGWAQNAKTPADYAAAYARADAAAKKISPDAGAEDFGYVDPADWKPGAMTGVGATTGQIQRNVTSQQSIAERAQGSRWAHQDRQDGLRARPQQITNAQMVSDSFARIQKGTGTDSDKAIVNRYLHGTKGGGSGLHSATTGAPNGAVSPQQAAKLTPGTRYLGQDGKWRVR